MSILKPDERALLHDIADVLIPATPTMPALRDADGDGTWLDCACEARADAMPIVRLVLRTLTACPDLSDALRGLHRNDRDGFDIVATLVAGTYYMVPRVRALIGYPGQVRNPAPLEQAADELADEIFDAAMNYPGSFRVAPA